VDSEDLEEAEAVAVVPAGSGNIKKQ